MNYIAALSISVAVTHPSLQLQNERHSHWQKTFPMRRWSSQHLFSSAKLMILNMQCYASDLFWISVLCMRIRDKLIWTVDPKMKFLLLFTLYQTCMTSLYSMKHKRSFQAKWNSFSPFFFIASWSIQWMWIWTETNHFCSTHKDRF